MPSRTVRISTENHAFQHLDALRRKRETRHRHRQFFVEGVRPIDQALAHGWPVEAFAYARDRRLSDWARDILARSPARTHYEVAPALFDKLSGKAEPSELLAIVAMPDDDLARIPLAADLLVVVCDRPASPGNLGTTLRSCDAFGAHGLIVAGHATDLYAPETVAASTGSLFAVPAVRVAGPADLLPWRAALRRALGPVAVVGSSEEAARDLAAHDFTTPTVLILGNETWGMSAAFRELCDAVVVIPIGGSASSLNVACAATVLLYEIARQRRAPRGAV